MPTTTLLPAVSGVLGRPPSAPGAGSASSAERPGAAPGRRPKPALTQRSNVLRVRDAPFPRPPPGLSFYKCQHQPEPGARHRGCHQTQVSKAHGVRVTEPVTLWGRWTTSSPPSPEPGDSGSPHVKGTEAAREERRDWLPWKGRRRRVPAEAGSEGPARAPTADRATRAAAQTWPGERAAARRCQGHADGAKRPRRPPFPDPAVARRGLTRLPAPLACRSPRLLPRRRARGWPSHRALPSEGWRQARGAPRTHHCQRRPPAASPALHSSSLGRTPRPALRHVTPGRRLHVTPSFLPPLPLHPLPTGLSPRPTGRRVWCEKGRLGAGRRAPPYGGGGGA